MSDEVEINLDEEFLKNLHKLPIVTSKVQAAAILIADAAKSIAPVDSGDYKASIEAKKSNRFDKSGAWVVTADDEGGWIEFGNGSNRPAHSTLRNAVIAAGFGLRGRRKSKS